MREHTLPRQALTITQERQTDETNRCAGAKDLSERTRCLSVSQVGEVSRRGGNAEVRAKVGRSPQNNHRPMFRVQFYLTPSRFKTPTDWRTDIRWSRLLLLWRARKALTREMMVELTFSFTFDVLYLFQSPFLTPTSVPVLAVPPSIYVPWLCPYPRLYFCPDCMQQQRAQRRRRQVIKSVIVRVEGERLGQLARSSDVLEQRDGRVRSGSG